MRSISTALLGALLLVGGTALAQPRPVRPTPSDKHLPPVHFPCTSTEFRPFFDKLIEKLESMVAKQPKAEDRMRAQSYVARVRMRGSLAMQDGTVTEQEAYAIFKERQ